jgi:hypothetical protein
VVGRLVSNFKCLAVSWSVVEPTGCDGMQATTLASADERTSRRRGCRRGRLERRTISVQLHHHHSLRLQTVTRAPTQRIAHLLLANHLLAALQQAWQHRRRGSHHRCSRTSMSSSAGCRRSKARVISIATSSVRLESAAREFSPGSTWTTAGNWDGCRSIQSPTSHMIDAFVLFHSCPPTPPQRTDHPLSCPIRPQLSCESLRGSTGRGRTRGGGGLHSALGLLLEAASSITVSQRFLGTIATVQEARVKGFRV